MSDTQQQALRFAREKSVRDCIFCRADERCTDHLISDALIASESEKAELRRVLVQAKRDFSSVRDNSEPEHIILEAIESIDTALAGAPPQPCTACVEKDTAIDRHSRRADDLCRELEALRWSKQGEIERLREALSAVIPYMQEAADRIAASTDGQDQDNPLWLRGAGANCALHNVANQIGSFIVSRALSGSPAETPKPTVKESLTVQNPVCSLCGCEIEWRSGEDVWRHKEPSHDDRYFIQTFCPKYGYPVQPAPVEPEYDCELSTTIDCPVCCAAPGTAEKE